MTDPEQGDFGEHIVTSMTSFALPSLSYEIFDLHAPEESNPNEQAQFLLKEYLERNGENLEHYSGCYIVLGNNSPQEYSAQVLEYSQKFFSYLHENLKAV